MKPKKLKNLYWETHPDWESKFKEFEDEEFKPIQGYEGLYFISNYGKVVSFKRNRPYLSGHSTGGKPVSGILSISLSHSKISKTHYIHRLVYSHFVGDIKYKQRVIHKDKNRSNNYYKNLKVTDWSESSKDSGSKKIKQIETDKLNRSGVLKFTREGKFVCQYPSAAEAAKAIGIKPVYIEKCLKGKQKVAGGYQWRYRVDPNFDDGMIDIPPLSPRKKMNAKILYQFDRDGTFIREYPSMSEAVRNVGISIHCIKSCIKNKKTVAGFQWRWASDPLFKNGIVNIPSVEKMMFNLQPVVQYTHEKKFVGEYASIIEAAEKNNIEKDHIYQCCTKKKKIGEFLWRFKNCPKFKNDIAKKSRVKRKNALEPHIFQFDLSGRFIHPYPTVEDAAKSERISAKSIRKALQDHKLTAGGYLWRYNDDPEIDTKTMSIPAFAKK